MQIKIARRVVTIAWILALLLAAPGLQPVSAGPISQPVESDPLPPVTGCPALTAITLTNTTAAAISDLRTVTSTITVSGAEPYVWDVNVQTFIQHTFSADLDITIQSPAGTVVMLTTDNGGSLNGAFDGTVWDDSGANSVTNLDATSPLPALSLAPEQALAAFAGEDPNGDWVLSITDDAGVDEGSLSQWGLTLTNAPAVPDQFASVSFSNTTAAAILDLRTVTSTITVSGAEPYLWDVNVQTFIQHTYAGDLDITIQSPAGTVVMLTTDNGGTLDNAFDGTVWDDSALIYVSDLPPTSPAPALALRPEQALAAFRGQDPNGVWVLTITDDASSDTGTLRSWSLEISTASGCPGPLTVTATDPASMAKLTNLQTIQVGFNKAALGDGSSRAANNPANYLLVEQGANTSFDTVSCLDGLAGDDVAPAIGTATYDNAQLTATLMLTKRLRPGSYRLFVCGTTSIWSASGQELNYGANDTLVDFTIQSTTATTGDGSANALPATGFAPGEVTRLPVQPAEKAYVQRGLTLEIPRLGVQAGIAGVPQSEGAWDVSWLGAQAGWLEGSAFPTWQGNSVITGHVWNADNTPGVFAGLKSLQYGDAILIHAYGQTYTYEVRESTRIDSASVQSALKHEKLAWLTLLTCEEYQIDQKTYSARRMVRAVLVSVQ